MRVEVEGGRGVEVWGNAMFRRIVGMDSAYVVNHNRVELRPKIIVVRHGNSMTKTNELD